MIMKNSLYRQTMIKETHLPRLLPVYHIIKFRNKTGPVNGKDRCASAQRPLLHFNNFPHEFQSKPGDARRPGRFPAPFHLLQCDRSSGIPKS